MTDVVKGPSRPLPRPTDLSRPFWEGARSRELRIQRCTSCARHVFYPRLSCPFCGGRELEWVVASGKGTVYTYTVARRPTHAAFADRGPYVIAIVELDEGPRMTTNIVGCSPEDVTIGMRVRAAYEDVDEEITLVNFEPVN